MTFADADYLPQITQTMWFEIGPFDQRAAIEAAIALRRALKLGLGKRLGLTSPWQKIKVDRQIVAIGKVYGVTHVYSTDSDVLTLARESGIEAVHAADLPVPPPEEIQLTLEDLAASPPSSLHATAPTPPSEQSLDAETPKDSPPAPALPEAHQAAPAPPLPGSSPVSAPKPPSAE